MPIRPSADAVLRRHLRARTDSLRTIGEATDIKWTTLANYEKGEGVKDGRPYTANITLPQAERLAAYFDLKLQLVADK